MLFLFRVVAVARKELDALVGHGLVVVLAVLSAVFLAIGIVVRQRATMDVPQEHGVSSVMFLTLLRRPLWWAGTAAAVVAVICTAAVCACVVIATRTMGWKRAVLLALAVGVLFGVVAVLTKLMMHVLIHEGVHALLITPVPYLLVLIAVFATFLQQSAFHAGSLQTSVPTMLVLEPVIAVLLGAIVLGENLDVSHLDAVLITISTVAMAAATVALGRDEGAYEEQLEAVVAQRPA